MAVRHSFIKYSFTLNLQTFLKHRLTLVTSILYILISLAHSLSNLRTLVRVSETVGYTPVLLIENSAYGTTDWRNSAMIYGTIHLGETVHIRQSQWNLMWLLWPLICSAYIARTLDLNRVNQINRNPTLHYRMWELVSPESQTGKKYISGVRGSIFFVVLCAQKIALRAWSQRYW